MRQSQPPASAVGVDVPTPSRHPAFAVGVDVPPPPYSVLRRRNPDKFKWRKTVNVKKEVLSRPRKTLSRPIRRAVQMRTIIGGGNGGTNLGHLFQFAADQFSDAGALLSAQHILFANFTAADFSSHGVLLSVITLNG
ncbi:hypothetical protein LXL04_005196 [Taraxacum kok-saghyz]